MRTIYAVWHQAEGVVTTHLFEEPPTETQLDALRVALHRRHNRPGMEMRVREVQLLGPTELPFLDTREAAAAGDGAEAALDMFTVSGTGAVE